MLKSIIIVTIMTSNLASTEQAYDDYLGYETVESGTVDAELATSWGAEKVAGREYKVMQPESQANVYLRFIQSDTKNDYQAMRQVGWNATELLVENPDALQAKFEDDQLEKHGISDSPFKVIGPPAYLTDQQNIRAMQVLGPNNELLYFTRIIDPAKSNFDLGQAESFVGRVFISVLGSQNVEATATFYRETLRQEVAGPYPYKVSVLSKAYGAPSDTLYPLLLSPLSGQFLIEIDQYPEQANDIEHEPGQLPNGVAMVSFYVDDLDTLNVESIAPPVRVYKVAYNGQRSVTIKGTEGELIELIESPP